MSRAAFAIAVLAVALLGASTTVESLAGRRMAIMLPDSAPIASVILVPGGTTLQRIAADGAGSNSGNAVMRIRKQLLAANFALAYLDDPRDLRAPIARMRAIKRPVFLLATSNGTVVSMANAVRLGTDGPDGLVLTSTVTGYSKPLNTSVDSIDVAKIAVPVFFLHNTGDRCRVSPPDGIDPLIARFKGTTDISSSYLTSDQSGPVNTTNAELQCSPQSPHGYMGIDDEMAAKVITWMTAHTR
jgi:hypothetical protein